MTSTPAAIRASLVFLGLALAAAIWQVPRPPEPRFVVAPATAPSTADSSFRFISMGQSTPSAHASSIAVMPDGSLLVAWFGGEREGARDVAIQMARVRTSDGAVLDQWVSLTCERLAALTHRVIRILGNPVIWVDRKGRIHMHVVSVSYGGWSGSSINQLASDDGGKTWIECRRLILSPLFNFSTLVRNQIVPLSDGTLGLPAYHEFICKWGLWVRLTNDGRVLQADRMQKYDGGWLQPAVAPTSATDAIAVRRSASRFFRVIGVNKTTNGGVSWPMKGSLEIPNPNASVSMIRLMDGSLLIATNPLANGRNVLQLFRSIDGGATWTASRTIQRDDRETNSEFSYPFLAQGTDGTIHLSYTWHRKGIRLCSFTPAWLETGISEEPAVENDP